MAAAAEPELSDAEILEQYNELRQEYSAVAQKISEIEMDRGEHVLVLEALKPLEGDRRCYRLVGGVLVERTAAEVLPAVQKNVEGMDEILKQLGAALQAKEKKIADHVAKHNIKFCGSQDAKLPDGSDAAKGKAGVLA